MTEVIEKGSFSAQADITKYDEKQGVVYGFVTVSASMAALSTYRLVRLPSNCVVHTIVFESEAQGA